MMDRPKQCVKSVQSWNWRLQNDVNDVRQWSLSGIFIVNFKQIPQIAQVLPSLTLNKYMPKGSLLLQK